MQLSTGPSRQYFSTMSKRIRENAQRHEEAQSIHLAAVIAFAGRAWRRPRRWGGVEKRDK